MSSFQMDESECIPPELTKNISVNYVKRVEELFFPINLFTIYENKTPDINRLFDIIPKFQAIMQTLKHTEYNDLTILFEFKDHTKTVFTLTILNNQNRIPHLFNFSEYMHYYPIIQSYILNLIKNGSMNSIFQNINTDTDKLIFTISYTERDVFDQYYHKDSVKCLMTALVYNTTILSPDLIFEPYTSHQTASFVEDGDVCSPILQNTYNEINELEKEYKKNNTDTCNTYRYDLSKFRLPTIIFNNVSLYHSTPIIDIEQIQILRGVNNDELSTIPVAYCNGRMCDRAEAISYMREPRKIIRTLIIAVENDTFDDQFIRSVISEYNMNDLIGDELHYINITYETFNTSLTTLKDNQGIIINGETIISNKGGRKLKPKHSIRRRSNKKRKQIRSKNVNKSVQKNVNKSVQKRRRSNRK